MKEERHPNIDEIIKVLKHLDNRIQRDMTVAELLIAYEKWNKKCINQIKKKKSRRLESN